MKQIALAVFCTSFVAACSSTPDQPSTAASSASMNQPAAPSAPARGSGAEASASSKQQALANTGLAASSRPAKNSVYFDYDSTAVKSEYTPVVSAHAKFLGGQRAAHVRVEGNADERGSREYNLALGQRRAEAVKQSLTLLGVPAERIEAISYGEEKPRAEEASEAAYAENRRADIVYANR